MENSPCEYCGIKKTCGKTKGCNRWKKWMRDAWAEIRRIYADYIHE